MTITMQLRITNSQRMALCTLIAEHMRHKEAPQVFVDCAADVETTTPELLKLFVDAIDHSEFHL